MSKTNEIQINQGNLLLLLIFPVIIIFQYCNPCEYKGNYNFSEDDLDKLYYSDSVPDNGKYCILYLLNEKDTVSLKIETTIYEKEEPCFTLEHCSTNLYFDEIDFFTFLEINIHTHTHTHTELGDAFKYYDFTLNQVKMNINSYNTTKIDSVIINNKLYFNVSEFETPDSTMIKNIYFTSKYGFIKIELTDSNKIELIPNN